MGKLISGVMLALFLISILTIKSNIETAKADYIWSETIYIRADGSVYPPNAPISTTNNFTYELTNNIVEAASSTSIVAIVIEKDNIVLDGNGYTLQGKGVYSSYGIILAGRTNITIKNVTIKQFTSGILLFNSSNNKIYQNTFIDDGLVVFNSYQNHIEDNTVNGKPLVYLEGVANCTIDDAGQIILVRCENMKVEGLSLSNTTLGIELWETSNSTIRNNTIANSLVGIFLYKSLKSTIHENNLTSNEIGISLYYSSNITIAENYITDNHCGAILCCSSHNTLRSNNIANNRYNFGVSGENLPDFFNDIDTSNTVDGKPICYWINVQNVTVPSEAGYVAIVNSTNITVKNLSLTGNVQGMIFAYTTGAVITQNIITDNDYGIWLYRSSNISIHKNNLTNNWIGIDLSYSLKNSLCRNILTNNDYSISLYISSNNCIYGNKITNSDRGICLRGSFDNVIYENDISNDLLGIHIYDSLNNKFYHNNFIENVQQVSILGASYANFWDDGYPSGGNYWSDYAGVDEKSGPDQDQPGSDGIGDTPYIIDEANIDRYPLISPWTPAPSYKFLIGDVVWATSDLYVREGPGLGYAILDAMVKGNRGVVLEGPMEADGYNWWKINYSVGIVGWSAENRLEKMPSPPQPPYGFAYWAEAAVSWAMQRLGRGDWSGLCMQFVANAYMQEEHKPAGYNAIDGAREFYRFNQEPNGWLQAPKGALIFFDMEGTNEYGHVGIYLGNGSIIHAYGAVTVNTIEETIAKPDVGRYLGWSYPPETWRPTKFMFNATYDGVNYPVTIFTNSTIMNFAFHQPLKQISFLVYGETGATGYCNITIPKALLQGEPWTVKLNGTSCSFTLTENQTHSFIYIAYTFNSAYEITIEGTWVIPEFHDFTIIQPLMLITFTLIILSKRKTKKPPNLPINPAKQNNLNHALKLTNRKLWSKET
ncbi:MAG: NosD domain-containing protein [Nitrososphaerota archaeon]